MFGGLRSISNVKTIVKNLAIVNIKSNGPVFAVRGLYSNYVYAVNIENVYISYADGVTPAGLITNVGYTKAMKLTNVVIDSSKANGNIKLAKDNKAYGISEDYVIERASSNKGRILYGLHTNYSGETSHSAKQTEGAFENVISIGLTPLLGASNAVNADMFTHTLTDGVYTHTAKTANLVGAWAAGNLATAEIPVPVSLKAGFASLVTNNDGSAISGYICNNCYKGFSLTTGICSSCSTVLTASSDLWTEVGSYNWGLYDLSTHVTGLVGDTNFKFAGISKYADVSKMPTNESYYSAFLGAQGNGMWAFVNNKLSFKGL